jgi:hypothetical protein
VTTDPEKLNAVRELSLLKDKLELRSFLCLTIYCWRFTAEFVVITKPVTNLMEKRRYSSDLQQQKLPSSP